MYIDTHCHLNFRDFESDRKAVIGNAKKAGVKKFIVPGVDYYSSVNAVGLAEQFPDVIYAAVGYHPYEAQKIKSADELEKILTLTDPTHRSPPIAAIGECGLDYHIYKGETATGKKDIQKRLFESQLKLALRHNLPVIMHCRDAFADLFNVLDLQPDMPRGVVHCFSGGLEDLRLALKRNLFIGIDGNVTYSKLLEMVVPHIPLDNLLLETDSPQLTPIPHRGKRNEPKYIPLVAQKIADLKSTPKRSIEESSARNTDSLFHLS